jgi:phospholipid/cholesterol/gamma-HCH transport system ATP-binding protein
VLSVGIVVGQGTPAELFASDSAWVKQFMHAESEGPVPFHFAAKPYHADLLQV